MFVKHGLRSAARMPGKTALTFLLVLLVAAMLGTSLSLTWSVHRTLEDCKTRYTTLVVPEYSTGEDETDPQQIARLTEEMLGADLPGGVISWEPSRVAQGVLPDMEEPVNFENARERAVLVVKVSSAAGLSEDVILTYEETEDGEVIPREVPVTMWHNAYGTALKVIFSYAETEGRSIALVVESRAEDAVKALEPGKYYLVSGRWEASWAANKALILDEDLPPLEIRDPHDLSGPECQAFLDRAQAMSYRMRSVTVRAGDHLADQFPFQQQLVHLEQGRMFTAEEERGGAEVCVVSSWLAKQNGWQLGDKVHLCIATRENSQVLDSYDPARGFDKEGEYTIVGLFSSNTDWNATVFIPTPADVDMTVNHYDSVLGQWKLENGSGNNFLAGCEGVIPAGIHLRLYDQGYSATARPLEAMLRIVGLISAVCLLAGVGFLLLTAWLYVSRQKQAGGLMVRLGASSRDVGVYYLSGLAAVAVPAVGLGAVISALVSRRASELMNGVLAEASRRNLSFSADKLMLQEDHAVTIGAAPWTVYAVIAALVLLLALAIALWFAMGTVPRQRPRKARSRRQSRVKTRGLTGGAAKYAWLSSARGGFRTAVALLAPLLAAVLLCLLVSSADNCRTQLDTLRRESTVRGYFTDWGGSQLSNTPAMTTDFLVVLDMDETVSATATHVMFPYRYLGQYDPETKQLMVVPEPDDTEPQTTSEGRATMAAGQRLYLPQFICTNRLVDAPQFVYTGAPEVDWLEDWDESFLGGNYGDGHEWVEMTDEEIAADIAENPGMEDFYNAYFQFGYRPEKLVMHPVPCVVSSAFMEAHKLALGDQFSIASANDFPSTWLMRIVGCYKKTAGRDNIYLPLSSYMGFSLDNREGVAYELLFGNVSDEDYPGGYFSQRDLPLSSAVFTFRCDDLEGLKQKFSDMGLSQVRELDANRKPFVLEDGVFQASQQSLQQRLWYMEHIFPVVVGLTEALALVLSFLLVLGRRKELWLMHCMGTSGARAFGSIYLEQIGLCLIGGAVGLAICRAAHIWNDTGVWQTGLFAGLWLLGALIAALLGVLRPDRREG